MCSCTQVERRYGERLRGLGRSCGTGLAGSSIGHRAESKSFYVSGKKR